MRVHESTPPPTIPQDPLRLAVRDMDRLVAARVEALRARLRACQVAVAAAVAALGRRA